MIKYVTVYIYIRMEMPCICTYLKHQYKNNNARSRTGISKTSNETNGCKKDGKHF